MKKDLKEFYQRRLPHWQPVGGVFFVTVCLKGAVSKQVLRKLRRKYEEDMRSLTEDGLALDQARSEASQKYLLELDAVLDKYQADIQFLKIPEVAQIIKDQLHRFDKRLYDLLAYCIMPNHFHVVFDTGLQVHGKDIDFVGEDYVQLHDIMRKIKGASANFSNKVLNRSGAFWQEESWDRWMRDEKDLNNCIDYTLMNPVKGGLVRDWCDWEHTFYAFQNH